MSNGDKDDKITRACQGNRQNKCASTRQMLKDFGCQDNSEPQFQNLACVGVFSILTTRSKNEKEDTEGCCGDYLRVHILFLEYE